jgi:hypothetical protein
MMQNGTQELESKVLFALEHPAARADRGTLAQLLGEPDATRQVLDHWDGGQRVVLAVLMRGGGGPADASQLLMLGCRTPLAAGAFSGFLDEAEGRVKGGQGEAALEVVLPPPLECMRELLKKRGFERVHVPHARRGRAVDARV